MMHYARAGDFVRTAQRVQLDAAVRLLDIRYFTKQAETQLRRLSGDLVRGT